MSPGRPAVTALFALDGFVVSSFYARLPATKDRLDLDAGSLSLALLGLTVGLLVAQPLTGALVSRRGSAPVATLGAVLCSLAVIGPAFAGSLAALVAATVLLGAGNGMLDVAMNVQGVAVEGRGPKPILSSLHAVFSLGVLVGAATSGLVAEAGVGVRAHLVGVACLGLVVAAAVAPRLLPGAADASDGPAFVRPNRALAAVGAIAFCALLCEGAVADWSAVHLRDTLSLSPGAAAAGLAVFSMAMVAGRLAGDRVTAAFGPVAHVRAGGAVAGGGLLLAALAPSGAVALAGFGLAGIGLSALFPLVIRAAAARGAAAPGPAIAAVSTAGYVGLVTGPPLVGLLADATSLRTALAAVLGTLCLALVVLAPAARTAAPERRL